MKNINLENIYFTGFADEASDGIDCQIQATLKLGWKNIEARNIDGLNIHDMPEEKFDKVVSKLQDAGIHINCFGSSIANWGEPVTGDFGITLEKVKRAIPRMQRLGTKLIRLMSYAILKDNCSDNQMEHERFYRLNYIKKIFDDAGLITVHENCMNYGGMSYEHTLRLLDNVRGLRLVFDTGNPVFSDDYSKHPPYPKQSSWEFYSNVREYIEYIHIKDVIWDQKNKKCIYTWPGEGQGQIKTILKDLFSKGYNGGISIEPHMATVFHDKSNIEQKDKKFDIYVEYGTRLESLIKEIKKGS